MVLKASRQGVGEDMCSNFLWLNTDGSSILTEPHAKAMIRLMVLNQQNVVLQK